MNFFQCYICLLNSSNDFIMNKFEIFSIVLVFCVVILFLLGFKVTELHNVGLTDGYKCQIPSLLCSQHEVVDHIIVAIKEISINDVTFLFLCQYLCHNLFQNLCQNIFLVDGVPILLFSGPGVCFVPCRGVRTSITLIFFDQDVLDVDALPQGKAVGMFRPLSVLLSGGV